MRLALLLVCTVLLWGPFPAAAQSVGDVLVVNTQLLNLRQGASTTAPVIAELPRGHVVTALQVQGDWVQVRTIAIGADLTGWLSRRYVVPRTAAAPVAPPRAVPVPMPFPDPLRIRDVRFDCAEGYISSGLTGCTAEVDIAITIPPPYDAFAADSVRIRCDAEFYYQVQDGLFQQSGSDWTTKTVYLSFGSGRGTLLLDLTFGFTTAPVISAGIDDLSCRPD